MFRFLKKYSEVILWNGALLVISFMNVDSATSFCILKNMGIVWCPGCGIGHAIHYALHFEFTKSIQTHVLGIPAALVLLYQSGKSIYNFHKSNHYEPTTTFKNVS